MRLVTADLREVLKATGAAVASRPRMPVLGAVQIATPGDGSAVFSATDYETWISSRCATQDEHALSALVSHRTLSAIVGVIKAKEVELTVTEATLTLTAGRSVWSAPLITGAMATGPTVPEEFGVISAESLRRCVRIVAPAAGREVGEPKFLPVVITGVGDFLCFTATDRYRVHVADAPFARSTGAGVSIAPAAKALSRAIESLTGTVTLCAGEESGLLGVDDGNTVVLMRMVADKVPDVGHMLARASARSVARTTVAPGDLIDAVKSVQPTIGDNGRGVILTIDSESITVASQGDDGTGAAPCEVVSHEGDGLVTRLNDEYLVEALTAVGGESVQLDWSDPRKPLLITSSGQPGRCLVMPIQDTASRWVKA